MSLLLLVEGPAGSGKSQVVSRMLAAGELDVVADYTALWAALRGIERDNEGKYPVRTDADPAVRSGLTPLGACCRSPARVTSWSARGRHQRLTRHGYQMGGRGAGRRRALFTADGGPRRGYGEAAPSCRR